jgi:hypothetical protein
MILWDDDIVRIESRNGQVEYFWLAGRVEVIDERPWAGEDCKKLFAHGLDPLTSELQSALRTYCYEDIRGIRPVARLPVAEDFEIDSSDRFYANLSNYHLGNTPDNQGVATQFWNAFYTFICSNEEPLLVAPLTSQASLRKSSFTQLGLDYMRQHYRFVKAESTRKQTAPTPSFLQRLLELTMKNRTTDADWTKPNIEPWIGKGIEF